MHPVRARFFLLSSHDSVHVLVCLFYWSYVLVQSQVFFKDSDSQTTYRQIFECAVFFIAVLSILSFLEEMLTMCVSIIIFQSLLMMLAEHCSHIEHADKVALLLFLITFTFSFCLFSVNCKLPKQFHCGLFFCLSSASTVHAYYST